MLKYQQELHFNHQMLDNWLSKVKHFWLSENNILKLQNLQKNTFGNVYEARQESYKKVEVLTDEIKIMIESVLNLQECICP